MMYTTYNGNAMKKQKYHDFDELHKKLMKDRKFKREYDALEVEFSIIHDIILKRIEKDMSQEELDAFKQLQIARRNRIREEARKRSGQ